MIGGWTSTERFILTDFCPTTGKPEIWAALKAASEVVGREDFDMAQALLDGAGVSLPGGMNILFCAAAAKILN